MEETLGKRIVSHRKRLGLTQDRLAEFLGVTAQAVSKWENDQSCPDITILPKLAEVFGISTDELLGLEKHTVHTAELVPEQMDNDAGEPYGLHLQNGKWEFQWDDGQKSGVGFALWVLLCGSLLFVSNLLALHVGFWDILWPTGLLIFGLCGLFPRFSFLRLGCALFGAYSLLNNFDVAPFLLGKEMLLPIFLLLFGLSLLVDALRKPKRESFHILNDGKRVDSSKKNHCIYKGEHFECDTAFGENSYLVQLPRLSGGTAQVSFGELNVDLSGCEEIADGCRIELACSFGQLSVLIPRGCCAKPVTSTSFASVVTKGSPDPDAAVTVCLECSANFGEIIIRYI